MSLLSLPARAPRPAAPRTWTRILSGRGAATVAVLALVAAVAPVTLAGPASAVTSTSRTTSFSFTGAEQEYVVPLDAANLRMVVVGAKGGRGGITHCGSGTCGASAGGAGAAVEALFPVCSTCAVKPGQTLYVEVGGDGGSGSFDDSVGPTPGGFNGGGPSLRGSGAGGGGASDVRTTSGATAYASRLVVAGGGGGGGSNGNTCGSQGWSLPGGGGGGGGINTGSNGGSGSSILCYSSATRGGGGGAGGTQSSGGTGGVAGGTGTGCNPADSGTAGALGQGGSGRWESNFTGGRVAATGGGGGGGGYYGGGGGAGGGVCGAYDTVGAGGGGGGSSFVSSAAGQFGAADDSTGVAKVELLVLSPSTTSLSCLPSPVAVGQTTTCTATVTDDHADPVTPTGTVTFSTAGSGAFGSATCQLSAGSCSTTFVPSSGAGQSDTITAKYAGDLMHFNSSGTAALPVSQGQGAITIKNLPTSPVFGGSFTPTFTQTGTGATTVSTVTPGVCTVATSGVVSFTGVGICQLQASALATTDYSAATGAPQNLSVSRAAASISISNLPSGAVYGGSFTPTLSQTGDGVTSVTSSTTSICTVAGTGVVSYVGVGTCQLRASSEQSANYAAATGAIQSFNIAKAPASISIDNLPSNATYGGGFTPTFTQVGDGAASVTGSTSDVCSVSSGMVTFVGVGTCTLRATALASAHYAAVSGAYQSFSVVKAPAAIAVDNLPSNATYGGSFTPTFTQTGDGAASVAALTTDVCTVTTSGVVSYVGAGTCQLRASALASAHFGAVSGAVQSFDISKAAASISIDNLPTLGVAGRSFRPTFTQTGDGTPSVTSLTTEVCTVIDGTVSFVAEGSCDLRAAASATGNYQSATGATQSLAVYAVPSVTLDPESQSVTTRQPVSFSAAAQSTLPATLQWQVSTDDGDHWSDLTSANDPTLTFTTSLDQDGNRYRARFTSDAGTTIGVAAILTVTKIPLTVTASSATMTYGDASPAISPRYGILAAGDTLDTVVLEQPQCSAPAVPSSPVGTYAVECAGGSFDPDYGVTYVAGNVQVAPATLTLTADDLVKTYGAANPPLSYTIRGFVQGQTTAIVSGNPTLRTAAGPDSPVGRYPVTAGVGSLSAPNYVFDTANGVLDVAPAALKVTASDATQVYGDPAPAVTPRYAGLVAGDVASSLTSQATCAAGTSATTDAGSYPTTCAGVEDPNYSVAYVPGTVVVTPAPQTIVSTTTVPRHPVVGTSLQLTATPGASDTPVDYTVSPSSDDDACVIGTTGALRLTAIGTCVVELSQVASRNYQSATSRVRIEIDTTRPSWTTPRRLDQGHVGSRYGTRLKLKGTPQAKVKRTGALPAGLTLDSGLRLSGRPTKAGKYSFVLTATNRGGSVSRTFHLRVGRAHR